MIGANQVYTLITQQPPPPPTPPPPPARAYIDPYMPGTVAFKPCWDPTHQLYVNTSAADAQYFLNETGTVGGWRFLPIKVKNGGVTTTTTSDYFGQIQAPVMTGDYLTTDTSMTSDYNGLVALSESGLRAVAPPASFVGSAANGLTIRCVPAAVCVRMPPPA